MPTGVLHLKEVDTDKITLDGSLSVSGASRLKGASVLDSTLSVGGSAKFAATETTNINVEGTLSVSGQTTIGGDIIPDTNDAYDIGSPEFKIRDMYVSDNSLWIGDETKISFTNGRMKFRKRKKDVVPEAILQAGLQVHQHNFATTTAAALAHAGVSNVEQMKLHHWHKYMRTLKADALITDIFRDNDHDYEETSASDAWKEINDTKIYTDMNVGVGTSDPDDTLHVKGSFKVESETGFKLIRSSVGGTDPTVIIDTQNFGTDETVNDLTGMECSKYTKLYRVYGRNSEGVGRSWYWGYANDDYSNFSLAFDGGGLPDPDIAFTFTTASELHCNKVYAALGGNADTATRLATPRKINGVDFDGTQDITIDTGSDGVDGITSLNGNIGIGTTNPQAKLHIESAGDTGLDIYGGDPNHPYIFVGEQYSNYANKWGMKMKYHGNSNTAWFTMNVIDNNVETNALTIHRNANVGIGTTNPSVKLHIKGTSPRTLSTPNGPSYADYGQLVITDTTAPSSTSTLGNLKLGFDASTGAFGTGFIQCVNPNIYTGPLVIQPYGGNVGIGTNTPHRKLDVHSSARPSGYPFSVGGTWSNRSKYLAVTVNPGNNKMSFYRDFTIGGSMKPIWVRVHYAGAQSGGHALQQMGYAEFSVGIHGNNIHVSRRTGDANINITNIGYNQLRVTMGGGNNMSYPRAWIEVYSENGVYF